MTTAEKDLLFGLLALQNGLVNQSQLCAGFRSWTLDRARSLADHFVARGDLDPDDRAAVAALIERQLKKHDGNVEQTLAAVPASRATHEMLTQLGDAQIDATLDHLGLQATQVDANGYTSFTVSTPTSNGQRFKILRPHARGGLGAVFVALDAELNREVALKQILESHADDPTSRQRFLLEAEVTGGLEHPGIVPVYGLGTNSDGRPYYAMRFIKGDSLKEAIDQFHQRANNQSPSPPVDPPVGEGRGGGQAGHGGRTARAIAPSRDLELRRLLRRFIDVCNAVEYAHSRGVLHRDIKPANIILGKHGETLVVDWGLAKPIGATEPQAEEQSLMPSSASGSAETLPGSTLGTPSYMSPEQAEGNLEALSPRSDVYSLGSTLYCLLTGKPPFDGKAIEILARVKRGEFSPLRQLDSSIDRALEAVCMKAMALRARRSLRHLQGPGR